MGLTPGHHCLHWISQSAHLRKKVEVKAEIPEASKHCGVPLNYDKVTIWEN